MDREGALDVSLREVVHASFQEEQTTNRGLVARALREAIVASLQAEPDYERTRLEMIAILTGERKPWDNLPPVAFPRADRSIIEHRPETGRERRIREIRAEHDRTEDTTRRS